MAGYRGNHRAVRRTSPLARRLLVITAALVALLTGTQVALAYFTSTGNANGSVTTGTLAVPTAVSGTQTSGTGTVTVTWSASTGTPAPSGYYVRRLPSSGPAQPACGTSAASTTTSTSCADNGVAIGTYTYVVVAVYRTWTATSAPSAPVAVSQASQTITFTSSPVAPTYGGTYTVTATGGGSNNPVTFSSGTPGVCTASGSLVTFAHAGSCTINANQAGNTYYSAAPQTQQSFTVAKAPQTVTFASTAPSAAVVGGSGYTPTASGGSSGNPVTFTIDATTTGTCSISGGLVTYQHAGTCTVDANQAGNADYLGASQVQQSYTVGKGAQAITFTSTAPVNAKVGGTTYTVTATGGPSPNPVTFTSASPSVCTVSGSTVSFVGAGTCTVNANQAGNADYTAATQVQQSFGVTKQDQTISFGSTAPGSATAGGTYTATASASSGLGVTFSTDTAAVCTVTSGGAVSFVAGGTCHVNADQAGNGTYNAAPQVQQSFTVAKQSQTINFTSTAPSGATVGGTYSATATASSALTVTFSTDTAAICTVTSGGAVSFVAAGPCHVNADQAGNGTYNAAPQAQQSITVVKQNQTITFTQPTTPANSGTTDSLVATSTSGLTVTFSSATTSVCTVSGATVTYVSAGTCTLNANQAGNANYNAAPQVQRTVTVSAVVQNQTISFTSTAPGNALLPGSYVVSATATSGLPVALASATPAVCTASGTNSTTVTFVALGTCTINANQAGNGSFNPAPQVQQSFVIRPPKPTLTSCSGSNGANPFVLAWTWGPGNPSSFRLDYNLTSGTQSSTNFLGTARSGSTPNMNGPTGTFELVAVVSGVDSLPATATFTSGGNKTCSIN